MKKIITLAVLLAGMAGLSARAQEAKTLDDYDSVNFYGIDFALAQVVGASETPSEFIDAFAEINRLFLTENEKYIGTLAKRLNKPVTYINLDYSLKQLKEIDEESLIVNHTVKALTDKDVCAELGDLDIKKTDGLGLVVLAGELNKGTAYGTFYYVFFDNRNMDVIECMPIKAKAGGFGLRNYWAGSFYRTINEINPTKFYQSKKKIKEGVTDGVQAVKEKITGEDK